MKAQAISVIAIVALLAIYVNFAAHDDIQWRPQDEDDLEFHMDGLLRMDPVELDPEWDSEDEEVEEKPSRGGGRGGSLHWLDGDEEE